MLLAGSQDKVRGVDVGCGQDVAGRAVGIGAQPAERLGGVRMRRAPVQGRGAGARRAEPAGIGAEAGMQAAPGQPLGYHRPA